MTLRIPERALLFGLLITLLLTLLAGLHRLGGRLQPIENLERLSLDQRFRLRGPQAHGDAVALVDPGHRRRYAYTCEVEVVLRLGDAAAERADHLLEMDIAKLCPDRSHAPMVGRISRNCKVC